MHKTSADIYNGSLHKTSADILQMGNTAIIPVGSLEQHSYHLPITTDILLAQAFADRIGESLQAFVLPCLPISTCYEHKGGRGSVWMNADTFFTMLNEIILNLKSQGFTQVVVIRGHGGIFVMDPAIRHINSTNGPDLCVCQLDPFFDELHGDIFETKDEVHSGEMETSVMLHLHPNLVQQEKAMDFIPNVPRSYLQYGPVLSYSPSGVWGKPSLATAEKGHRYFEACLTKSLEHIKNVFDMGNRY